MISRVSVSRRGLYLRLCILVQKSPSLLFSLSIFLSFFTTSLPLLYSCSPVPMIFASTSLPLFYSPSRFLWDMFSQVALSFILPLHFPLFFFAQVSPSFRIIFLLSFFFFSTSLLFLLFSPCGTYLLQKAQSEDYCVHYLMFKPSFYHEGGRTQNSACHAMFVVSSLSVIASQHMMAGMLRYTAACNCRYFYTKLKQWNIKNTECNISWKVVRR